MRWTLLQEFISVQMAHRLRKMLFSCWLQYKLTSWWSMTKLCHSLKNLLYPDYSAVLHRDKCAPLRAPAQHVNEKWEFSPWPGWVEAEPGRWPGPRAGGPHDRPPDGPSAPLRGQQKSPDTPGEPAARDEGHARGNMKGSVSGTLCFSTTPRRVGLLSHFMTRVREHARAHVRHKQPGR